MHVAGAGAGLGRHRAVPACQVPVTGLVCYGGQPGRAVRRDPGGHQGAAQPRRGGRGQPPQPDQLPAGLVQAGAHPGAGLHLEPHQLLLDPRLPAEHPHQIGAGQTVAPVDGSRSTNSSSTHSVIASAACTAPRRPTGTFAARPAPPDPGLTTTCCSGSGRSGSRWPSALGHAGDRAGRGDQRPQQGGQRDGGCRLHGHRLGGGQRDDLPGCRPGCLQRLPGRDRQGPGHRLAGSVDVTESVGGGAWAAGAIVSAAGDVARFYAALLSGRVLPATLLAQMRTTVTPTQPGYGNGYGLGLMRFDLPCGPAWGHEGNLFTYTAMAFASSDGHRAAVVLVNGFTGPSLDNVFTAMQRAAEAAYCHS